MEDLHLYIYGEVESGLESYVQSQLVSNPNPENIIVHISSEGGGVYTGWTVGNILKMQKANTIAKIEGLCASIATYIALSCDKVEMAETAQFMIHNASIDPGSVNKNEMKEYSEQLDQIDQDLISVYSRKTNFSRSEISEMMDNETFLSTDDAVKMGFVDSVMKPLKAVAKFDIKMNKEEQEKQNGILGDIVNKLDVLYKNITGAKNEVDEPENINVELEDGTILFVRSEDGELEGKPVVMTDEEGNPTDQPAPDGTHMLRDGRSITVEDGVVVSVQEAENEDTRREEMEAKIKALESEKAELKNQLNDANEKAKSIQNETASEVKALSDKVNELSQLTVGAEFRADKGHVQPQDKSVNTGASPKAHSLDGFASRLNKKR
ncbi:MAG: ATP-dependent Clp protease proteolytic subunit [Psychroserpens sp.]|nr:ATP-dependent Clp protease proteolytic subunit [Psychroserpens sp.]